MINNKLVHQFAVLAPASAATPRLVEKIIPVLKLRLVIAPAEPELSLGRMLKPARPTVIVGIKCALIWVGTKTGRGPVFS